MYIYKHVYLQIYLYIYIYIYTYSSLPCHNHGFSQKPISFRELRRRASGQRGGVLREVDGHRGAAEVHPAGAGAATTTGEAAEKPWENDVKNLENMGKHRENIGKNMENLGKHRENIGKT